MRSRKRNVRPEKAKKKFNNILNSPSQLNPHCPFQLLIDASVQEQQHFDHHLIGLTS
jgi:hypothetical protein